MPFNCESFHELLEAVIQATMEKDFDPGYVAMVARFFSDFAVITKRDGYVVADHVRISHNSICSSSTGLPYNITMSLYVHVQCMWCTCSVYTVEPL